MEIISALFVLFGWIIWQYFFNKTKTDNLENEFIATRMRSNLVDCENQSIQENDDKPTVISQNQHLKYYFEDCKTLFDVLSRGSRQSEDGKCFGKINFSRTGVDWISYEIVLRRTKFFADGLLQLGLEPKSTFGIYSINCPEYTIAEYACHCHSIVVVPIYDIIDSQIFDFISKQAQFSVMLCDTLSRLEEVLNASKLSTCLKHIILIRSDSQNNIPFREFQNRAKLCGITLHTYSDVEKYGALNAAKDHPPDPEDLAAIMYTSGTTGLPKGAMLTHGNIIANISALIYHSDVIELKMNSNDVHFSYLPLGHIFERISQATALASGAKIAFYSGNIKNIGEDLKIIKPTALICVPQVLYKIYNKIHDQAKTNILKSHLLNRAYEYKKKQLLLNGQIKSNNNTIWDHLVFSKVRRHLGGNIKAIFVGSAPMNADVLHFIKCAIGCDIFVGYGQTETSGSCTITAIDDFSKGHVGSPLASCSIKLISEIDDEDSSEKGEIAIKGPIVFKGYFKNEILTAQTIDEDGWLHSGDIGQWNKDGTLQILGRKQDIFKLSNGEFVSPPNFENIYSQCPFVHQIFIYGDSSRSRLVAVVVPQLELTRLNYEQHEIKTILMEKLETIATDARLKPFQRIKNIYIHNREFTVGDNLITPTFKNKRSNLKQFFQKQIAELYNGIE